MSEVTYILSRIEAGDPGAAEQLLPLVYEELRKLAAARMASERPDHSLQATALVHEAWLRLVNSPNALDWNGRRHFFAAAAEAMRRILVESARRRSRLKRGRQIEVTDLDAADLPAAVQDENLMAVNEALEQLALEDAACAEIVKLRFFTGLTIEETAAVCGISVRAANREWAFAKAFLAKRLRDSSQFEN